MEKFHIEGGYPLSGTVVPAGNKNAALPALAASLLTEEQVVLRNIPRIRDVEAMVALLEHLGVEVEWREDNVVALCAANVDPETEIPVEKTERIRASFLVTGPLLARFGRVVIPPPGGDVIGRRRLDPHLDAFRALGATVASNRVYRIEASDGLRACDFFMDEPSVMASENALMAAALTPGSTVIHNAASEPHVQDVCRLLLQMGARIEGIGSNQLIVHGSEQLGGADFAIGPDHIEIGSFIALAAATRGEIRIKDCVRDDLRATELGFARLGVSLEYDGSDVIVPADQELRVRDDDGRHISKIEDGPWPAFPADLTSIALALATQAEGMVLI
ncbi:MAG TPA: UDP-N-acetylglucosamine 1-carboxyvinyltransferase, partial [Thermoleophilaceae bacterium]|nr:UDP-N-acetylglucosamine 1-carboxyvinyltransferase [Thermoleophilaceae bacterium]